MSFVSVDHEGYPVNMSAASCSVAFSALLTASDCSSCCPYRGVEPLSL